MKHSNGGSAYFNTWMCSAVRCIQFGGIASLCIIWDFICTCIPGVMPSSLAFCVFQFGQPTGFHGGCMPVMGGSMTAFWGGTMLDGGI